MSDNTGLPVAINNPERRNQLYGYDEVFGLGSESSNRHVVNPGDIIVNAPENEIYWVVSVTPDGIPTIQPLDFRGSNGATREEVVLGTGPGLASEAYRIYINNSVIPHQAFVDSRVVIPGSENSYMKLFRGYDISPEGTVVSGIFNSADRLTSENIPLEKVSLPHYGNHGYKVPVDGYVTHPLVDGEVVTAVIYTNSGEVTTRFTLLVVNTEFIRNLDASSKRIVDISLNTPYLSDHDTEVVEIPLGMVAQSSSFIGTVTYSDGSTQSHSVDGSKFSLHGYETFIASNIGEIAPAVLTYTLSEGELSNFIKQQGDKRFITKPYRIKTVESDSRHKVKLFLTPYWDKSEHIWVLDYWLYSLERNVCLKVNDLVETSVNTTEFDGEKFGVAQQLTLALNLDQLGPGYHYERHVETISITLLHPVSQQRKSTYYRLNYGSGDMVGLKAIGYVNGKAGDWTLDLSNGYDDVDLLLNYWYYNTSPLRYPFNESIPPHPTHVRITIGSWVRELAIEDVNKLITKVTANLYNGAGIYLEFVKISGLTRLELAKMSLIAVMS